MSSQRYSPEFKDESVRQVIDRGYSVSEVVARRGVSAHSLYKWVKAAKPDKSAEQDKELFFEFLISFHSSWPCWDSFLGLSVRN